MPAIKDWPVLGKINLDLLCNIEMIYVFGSAGDEVILVTNDDNVYAFGANADGCLGLGHNRPTDEPTRVDELCQKGVNFITANNVMASGYNFALALTKTGRTYAWGANRFGTLANGTTIDCHKPGLVESLRRADVVDVSCGYDHCLALSRSGEVYGWGYNGDGRVGDGRTAPAQTTPVRVTALRGENIVAIACGAYHSLALTESGRVYGWGDNHCGQLGVGNNFGQNSPVKVIIDNNSDIIVQKVCAGFSHTTLLSSDGSVYTAGYHSDGDRRPKLTFAKLSLSAKVVDILAVHSHDRSFALTDDQRCLVWGTDRVASEVPHSALDDAYNFYRSRRVTPRPLRFGRVESVPAMYERHSRSFDDRQYSDIRFRVDGKYIYAQKLYLRSACKHFDDMFADRDRWLESGSAEIEISHYSYSVYHSFLKYLYTNTVDIGADEAVDLLDLANSYMEDELVRECVKIIKDSADVHNVGHLFVAGVLYNLQELRDYCHDYALNRKDEIRNTIAYELMDVALKQMLCI